MKNSYKYSFGKAILFLIISIMLLAIGMLRAFDNYDELGFSIYSHMPLVLNGTFTTILGIGFLIGSILNFKNYKKPIPPKKWEKRKNWLKHK